MKRSVPFLGHTKPKADCAVGKTVAYTIRRRDGAEAVNTASSAPELPRRRSPQSGEMVKA